MKRKDGRVAHGAAVVDEKSRYYSTYCYCCRSIAVDGGIVVAVLAVVVPAVASRTGSASPASCWPQHGDRPRTKRACPSRRRLGRSRTLRCLEALQEWLLDDEELVMVLCTVVVGEHDDGTQSSAAGEGRVEGSLFSAAHPHDTTLGSLVAAAVDLHIPFAAGIFYDLFHLRSDSRFH